MGLEKIESKLISNFRKNPWILSTIVLGIITLILLLTSFNLGDSNFISGEVAANNLVDFLNTRADGQVSLGEVSEESGLYKVVVEYQGDSIPLYTTKDGKYFIQGVVPLTGEVIKQNSQDSTPKEVPKSDKPQAELFVMTYCPYGTQAEKGFIPFIEAMGDLIDAKIRFVHYFMHGDDEEQETYRQTCIREEQPEKYLTYLRAFLEEGDFNYALTKAGIDSVKLNNCISSGKGKEYYELDSSLSEQYGVRGSPTLVVNGVIVPSGRSSDAFLQTICSAFNNAPSECSSLTLNSETPNPMWGWDSSTNTGTTASCG